MPNRPMSANGPVGNPASTSAGSITYLDPAPVSSLATRGGETVTIDPAPVLRNRNGIRVNGLYTRLTMKPGESAAQIGVCPQPSTIATARSTTKPALACPATAPTSGRTGTGLKK